MTAPRARRARWRPARHPGRRPAEGHRAGAVRRRQPDARPCARRAGVQHRRPRHGRAHRSPTPRTDHPDVLRVLTDFAGVTLPFDMRQVSLFGQPVAVVVANTLEAATHGAALVRGALPHRAARSTDIDAPQAERRARQDRTGARLRPRRRRRRAASRRRRCPTCSYSIARNNHNPMELPATIARWDGDRLTVWDKVQGITSAQEAYCRGVRHSRRPRSGSSRRSSAARSAAPARPGRTNCSPRSRPARCAARSSSC